MAGTPQAALLNQQRQRQQQLLHQPILAPLRQQMDQPQQEQLDQVQAQPILAEPVMEEPNGSKRHPNESQVLLNEQRANAKALKMANRKDSMRRFSDRARHAFYDCVKPLVSIGLEIKSAFSSTPEDAPDDAHEVPLPQALNQLRQREIMRQGRQLARQPIPEVLQPTTFEARTLEMREQMLRDLRQEIPQGNMTAQQWETNLRDEMYRRAHGLTVRDEFLEEQRANVEGGTKPVSIRKTESNQRWLVKDAKSCIGTSDPLSPYATKVGADIQKLVHPDTAIEAHIAHLHGRGTVSYQKMLSNVTKPVDLMKFSRTPESMTTEELETIQTLTPQMLREHTTDWLMCNFDTKGENFIVTEDALQNRTVHGIDKEAGFRRIMHPGAQKMSKDYKGFDQNTVYNRIFQGFSSGTMDLDLKVVEAQVHNVEAMSDDAYMAMFDDYLQVRRHNSKDNPDEVSRRILARKKNLRAEYREFFTKLIEERITNTAHTPEEEAAMRLQYFGDRYGGTFVFDGDTPAMLQAERQAKLQAEANDAQLQQQRQKAALAADKHDEKSYNRRHALYDFSKAVVMGLKSIFSSAPDTGGVLPSFDVAHKDLEKNYMKRGDGSPGSHDMDMRGANFATQRKDLESQVRRQAITALYQRGKLEEDTFEEAFYSEQELQLIEQETAEMLSHTTMNLRMSHWEDINLGGTKPMSQYYLEDGSKWLAKQAVNCMGYYKEEGVLLTTAGAILQTKMHPETAVEAFSGVTADHGFVSFQRRLDHVESGPNKLDLFKFSRHPEIATPETVAAVQELAPQILREHATDWLLCNFDTKGENFIITKKPGEERVLHGIDKEAAFHKLRDPKAQAMSMDYKPHANNTLYNVVFTMYAENKMDLNLFDVAEQITKSEAMDEQEYMSMFQPYLDSVQKNDPEHLDEIRQKIWERKANLRATYETFFTQLVLKRCKGLHPTEAAALRARYFNGDRFNFPD
ncbi:MAG: hypothetical protein R3Y62_02320 [Eubacteriales bacterium]